MKLLLIITFLWPVFQAETSCPERKEKQEKPAAEQHADVNLISPFIVFTK